MTEDAATIAIPWDEVMVVFSFNPPRPPPAPKPAAKNARVSKVANGYLSQADVDKLRRTIDNQATPAGWRFVQVDQTRLHPRAVFRVVGPVRAGDGAAVRALLNTIAGDWGK